VKEEKSQTLNIKIGYVGAHRICAAFSRWWRW